MGSAEECIFGGCTQTHTAIYVFINNATGCAAIPFCSVFIAKKGSIFMAKRNLFLYNFCSMDYKYSAC